MAYDLKCFAVFISRTQPISKYLFPPRCRFNDLNDKSNVLLRPGTSARSMWMFLTSLCACSDQCKACVPVNCTMRCWSVHYRNKETHRNENKKEQERWETSKTSMDSHMRFFSTLSFSVPVLCFYSSLILPFHIALLCDRCNNKSMWTWTELTICAVMTQTYILMAEF